MHAHSEGSRMASLCRKSYRPSGSPSEIGSAAAGATLIEALIASILIAIAAVMAVTAANAVISFIYGTDKQAAVNALIDNDIARIKELAQSYTACTDADGSTATTATDCTGFTENNSSYYVPSVDASVATTQIRMNSFGAYCRSANTAAVGKSIVDNFITSVRAIPLNDTRSTIKFASQITRTVAKADTTNPYDHLVSITYTAPGGVNRRVQLQPFISFFCP